MSPLRIRVAGLLRREKHFLAVEHTKNNHVSLLLPGGGADGGLETLQQSLQREFMEELGMQVQVGKLLLVAQSVHPEGQRNILHMIFEVESTDEPVLTGEDPRVTGWRFVKSPQELEFRPDILPQLLELMATDSYNSLEVVCPDWIPESV